MSPGQALLAVRHSYFEVLVMLTLLASSATLGIETHLNMQDVESVTRQLAVGDGWQAFFYWGDYFVNGCQWYSRSSQEFISVDSAVFAWIYLPLWHRLQRPQV